MTSPHQDPGWAASIKGLVPVAGPALARRDARSSIATMRVVFISFVWAIVLFGVVLAFLDLTPEDGEAAFGSGLAAGVVVAVGVLSVVLGRVVDPAIDGSTDQTAAATYRTRFFLRLAIGEVPALVGFVLAFLSGSIVPYLVGAAFTLVSFARTAPTAASVQRDVETLQSQGSAVDLAAILYGSASGQTP